MKTIFAVLVAVLLSMLLQGCGNREEVADLKQTIAEKNAALAKTNAELAVRLAVESADGIGKREARASTLKHTSGCNVTPLALAQDPGYAKYARFMEPAYKSACRGAVLAMASERSLQAKAAKKAKAEKKARLAAAAKKPGVAKKGKHKVSATKQG